MRVDLFDFELPEDRIALRPVAPRDAARLLEVGPREMIDRVFADLPMLLGSGDALVVNDTRVIPAELRGERFRGDGVAAIAITLRRRLNASSWEAFARPAKRLQAGDRVRFGNPSESACLLSGLDASIAGKNEDGSVVLAFDLSGPALDEAIAALGHIPLPPYIAARRPEDDADRTDYQTVFADRDGAIAAPTAGLHFTDDLLARLGSIGVGIHKVTLHVGAGTFLPVKAEDTADHRMHAEWGELTGDTAEKLNAARANGGRIVAVGTTALRVLESAADESGQLQAFSGDTEIFITPGYRFRATDRLITNFHLPRSTLFMLVSAFSGRQRMLAAYRHAMEAGYRFYSYGDACFLHPAGDR
ncbi:MAG: tRNA preQ1(34) S-adenosylmethionine ribosyltransferase-isomerase QueA [Bauldia sp.]